MFEVDYPWHFARLDCYLSGHVTMDHNYDTVRPQSELLILALFVGVVVFTLHPGKGPLFEGNWQKDRCRSMDLYILCFCAFAYRVDLVVATLSD